VRPSAPRRPVPGRGPPHVRPRRRPWMVEEVHPTDP
jgi:hypothetical protein